MLTIYDLQSETQDLGGGFKIQTKTSVSGGELAKLHRAADPSYSKPYTAALTIGADALTNYVASDINKPNLPRDPVNGREANIKLEGAGYELNKLLDDKFLTLQIHELGNSISALFRPGGHKCIRKS